MRLKHLLTFCCIAIYFQCISQDLHSTNYDYNQVYINPAEAGAFLGTYRVMGSYRDQYDAFIVEGYNRQIASVDMPLNIRFIKKGWTGYGLGLFNDKSGDLGMKNTGITASLSYHIPLDKKNRNVISFGLQVSRLQRGINNSNDAKFGSTLAGTGPSELTLLDQFSVNSTDYNVGILYKSFINKRTKLEVGGSVMHLISGKSRTNKMPRRFNLYAKVPFLLSPTWKLEPRIYSSFARNNFDINLQSLAHYRMKPDLTLGSGLGYRIADALQLLITANYKGWEAGLSYDVTVSGARKYNNGQGGFEIGIKKVFIIPAKIKIDRVEICPRN